MACRRPDTPSVAEDNISKTPLPQFLTYTQRPDLRPPILNVSQYDPAAVSPGYWFLSPYGAITPAAVTWDYQPFEDGPMIYDNAGVCCDQYGSGVMLTISEPRLEWGTYASTPACIRLQSHQV